MHTDHVDNAARLRALARSIDAALPNTARGRQLESNPQFQELVALLAAAFDAHQRAALLTDESDALRCATLVTMAQAGDRSHHDVARVLDRIGYYALDFAIEFLGDCTDPEVLGLVLMRLPGYVGDYQALRYKMFDYLGRMLQAGVAPALSDATARLDFDLEERRDALSDYDFASVDAFVEGLRPVERRRRALDAGAPVAWTPALRRQHDALHSLLADGHARPSVLVVGEAGSGRRTLVRSVLDTLVREGWTVIEASPRELLAEHRHVEPVAERIHAMGRGLAGERTLWYATHWFELLEDAASNSATTVLEHLWPQLESGALQVVATASPHNRTRATDDLRQFDTVFRTLEMAYVDASGAHALAQEWAQGQSERLGMPVIDAPTLAAAIALAERSLPRRTEPGRILGTLQEALRDAWTDSAGPAPIRRDGIVRVLARRSGESPGWIADIPA